jgi:hypothetical protein
MCHSPRLQLRPKQSNGRVLQFLFASWRGMKQCATAPLPWGPRTPRKANISTLHKSDILTLQLYVGRWPLTSCLASDSLRPDSGAVRSAVS